MITDVQFILLFGLGCAIIGGMIGMYIEYLLMIKIWRKINDNRTS